MNFSKAAQNGCKWAINAAKWNPNDEEFEHYLKQVQTEEQTRIRKFRFEIDRKRALCGRLIIRHIAAKLFSIDAAEVKLGRTENNKPILVSPENKEFEFNISHHGDWVVLVWSHSGPVGVDVMDYQRPRGCSSISEFFKTMRSSFTESEWSTIESSPDENERLKEFYRHWSLKESYIKAIGLGLGFELCRASFEYIDPNERRLAKVKIDGTVDQSWHFIVEQLDHSHCVSIACNHSPMEGKWQTLKLDGKGINKLS